MIVGAMDDIEILVRTKDGSQPNISWKTAMKVSLLLSVEGSRGTVKALKPGTSTLTIQCADKTLIRKITVYPVNSLSSLKWRLTITRAQDWK